MPQKELPAKYYIDHFVEFMAFVTGPCKHLIDDDSRAVIAQINALDEDATCLLVRTLNRKHPVLHRKTLEYDEIADTDRQIARLLESHLFAQVQAHQLALTFSLMTKPQLLQLLKDHHIPAKASAPKAELLALSEQHISFAQFAQHECYRQYVVRNIDPVLNYWLFLFFGDVRSKLNKFSMRDLGVMPTRQGDGSYQARFDTLQDAQTAYVYALKRDQVNQLSVAEMQAEADALATLPATEHVQAKYSRDRYLFKLGKGLIGEDVPRALAAWALSDHPEATEKWLRHQYQQGMHDEVRARLEAIMESPESDTLLLFAEDFYARKFNKKRTSVLTDLLRSAEPAIALDEMYRDTAEQGLIRYYQRNGVHARHSENQLWRALFGLTFWTELFELDAQGLVNEFDSRPRLLQEDRFYAEMAQAIDARLQQLTSAQQWINHLTQMATRHYGKANGMFFWHPELLAQFVEFLQVAPLPALHTHLRNMSQRYRLLCDGYPDLMIIDGQSLRFEEVKAPGDQLRKNQLLTLRALQQAGFTVAIRRVCWWVDPKQPYVVVDVETTGGKPDQHRITEIGMVKVVEGKVTDSWQSLINPQRHIPRFITELTGIDNHMVSEAPLFADVASQVAAFCDGCIFVAHNVNFDYGFFRQEFARIDQPFKLPKLCTVRESRKAFPGLASYSLANLCEHFSIDMERHHRALSDANAAAQLLMRINQVRMANAPSAP